MTGPAIELVGVGKRFVKYDDQPMLLNQLRLNRRSRRSALWALRGIEFDVQPGESVGVLGRNGAGKSTLLQLLCGVTAPTEGLVRVTGRVAPLISVGVGFHPELTGRENIYVNGTVLGLDRATIDRRFDAIVEFAELEKFIDTPVKFYSSGMFVRLGFSVAVEADPDVLLVDEILAVGDFNFQLRCFDRMGEIRNSGTTLVVVSHNLNAIRGFCERALLLEQGQMTFDGPAFEGISRYYQTLGQVRPVTDDDGEAIANEALEVVGFDLHDAATGRPTAHVLSGDDVIFRLHVRAREDITDPFAGVTIATENGTVVYSDSNQVEPFRSLRAGESATIDIGLRAALTVGGFTARAGLHRTAPDGQGTIRLGGAEPLSFYVSSRRTARGLADLGATFGLDPAP